MVHFAIIGVGLDYWAGGWNFGPFCQKKKQGKGGPIWFYKNRPAQPNQTSEPKRSPIVRSADIFKTVSFL